MKQQKFTSVWDAIEDVAEEAENMKIRSRLMMMLREHIRTHNLTQHDAALKFGVKQPRISELVTGRITLFSIDKLISMMAHGGIFITDIITTDKQAA